jgi:hypothetical protein
MKTPTENSFEWINLQEQLPPENTEILVMWLNKLDRAMYGVSCRAKMPRHGGKDSPMDDRYWITATGHEIKKPLYWMHLPEMPAILQNL